MVTTRSKHIEGDSAGHPPRSYTVRHQLCRLRNDCQFLDWSEFQQIVLDLNSNQRVRKIPTVEQALGERIFNQILNDPPQRPRAIRVVVTAFGQEVHCLRSYLEVDFLLA